MNAVHLRRVDPAHNMSCFYLFDAQPDLFGGVLLSPRTIGTGARCVAEFFDDETLAAEALHTQAERKKRKGLAQR